MPSQLGLVVVVVLTEQVTSAGPQMTGEALPHGAYHLRGFWGGRTGEDSCIRVSLGFTGCETSHQQDGFRRWVGDKYGHLVALLYSD